MMQGEASRAVLPCRCGIDCLHLICAVLTLLSGHMIPHGVISPTNEDVLLQQSTQELIGLQSFQGLLRSTHRTRWEVHG